MVHLLFRFHDLSVSVGKYFIYYVVNYTTTKRNVDDMTSEYCDVISVCLIRNQIKEKQDVVKRIFFMLLNII